jgi:hypothetical protein
LCAQTCTKCSLDEWWVRTYSHQLAVIHGKFELKLAVVSSRKR